MDEKEFRESINPGVQFVATDQITGIYSFLGAVSQLVQYRNACPIKFKMG